MQIITKNIFTIISIVSIFISVVLLYLLCLLIKFEIETYENSHNIDNCASMKDFLCIIMIIDIYTVFITSMYTIMAFIELFNKKIDFYINPLCILLTHVIFMRYLNFYYTMGVAGHLTLKCIHEYNDKYPNMILIYNVNMNLSIAIYILTTVFVLLISCCFYDTNNTNHHRIINSIDANDDLIITNNNSSINANNNINHESINHMCNNTNTVDIESVKESIN